MKVKSIIIVGVLFFCGVNVFAQNGGKAEPNRIKFAKGKSAAAVSGKIKGDEQSEYTFAAGKGQKVNIKITSLPPGKFSSFKVLNAEGEPQFVSEHDSNYRYVFTAQYTGDYLIWVNFRPAGKVNSAKYLLTLSITR